MSAVRQCETRRRQCLRFLLAWWALIGAVAIVTVPLIVSATPTSNQSVNSDSCHDDYVLKVVNSLNNYEESFNRCQQIANETQIELTIDEDLERKQIEKGSTQVCENLAQCEALEDNMEYFECINVKSGQNMDILIDIRFNASRALTRLREDYNEVQQTFALCLLEAQRVYVDANRQAYDELFQCLSQIEKAPANDGYALQ